MTIHTPLCDLFRIEHPIIQAGMGRFTSAELVAAACNAGALGNLGTNGRSAAELRDQIAAIRQRTDRPFAVNFLISDFDEESFAAALEARVPVISFALGAPGDHVRRAQASGALVLHQVHTVEQARQAAEQGVDALIAQGGEAGGFGQYVGVMALVPQVVDAVRPLPVVAAGGIADGRGLAAALLLGAAGVNIGTRFLATVEAPIPEGYKQAIVAARSEDTVKVEFWNDVMPAPGLGGYGTVPRAIRTPFSDRWLGRRGKVAQRAGELRDELFTALPQGRLHDYVPFAGQTVGLIREILPVEQVVRRIVAEAEEALQRGAGLVTPAAGLPAAGASLPT